MLDELVERFGGGNRSAFLRVAVRYMRGVALAEDLLRTQAYGAERLAAAGMTLDDLHAYCEREVPAVVHEASKRLVAAATAGWEDTVVEDRMDPMGPTATAFFAQIEADRGLER